MKAKSYLFSKYENSHLDILTTFVERASQLCFRDGLIGAITNRTCFYLTTLTNYRKEVLSKLFQFEVFLDLGEGVLDAVVEPAAYVLRNACHTHRDVPFIRLLVERNKGAATLDEIQSVNSGLVSNRGELSALPNDLKTYQQITTQLQALLPGLDPFWPRWIVEAKK